MAKIEFIDQYGGPTKDYVTGWPTILVDIEIGFDPAGLSPTDEIKPNFKRVRALVDTGANHTVADTSLTKNHTPKRTVPSKDVSTIIVEGDVFAALLSIVDLTVCPHHIEIGSRPASAATPFPLIVGRDVLSFYRLIYDTPREHFSLERST